MYPMISCLVVLFFYTQHAIFAQPRPNGRTALVGFSLALGLAIIFSHAIAFFFVFFLSVYFLLELVVTKQPWRRFLEWGAFYACLAVAATPVAISSVLRDTDGTVEASASGVKGAVFALSSLMTEAPDDHFAVGLLLFLVAAGGGLVFRQSRKITLCLLILPVLMALLIGFVAKPMFKPPVFASFCLPFVALAAGAAAGSLQVARSQAAACLAGAVLLCVSITVLLPPKPRATNFAAASGTIKIGYQPGDIIYAPTSSMFWGINRYIFGPHWGSPLEVADLPNERWQRVYQLLGPSLVARFGLMPKSNLVENGQFRVLTGRSDIAPARAARRIWLVTYYNREPPPTSVYEGRQAVQEHRFGGMRLTLLEMVASAARQP